MTMKFNPDKPAAEMTAAELMAAHIAMNAADGSAQRIVTQVRSIYSELNSQMGDEPEDEQDEDETSS